MDGLHALTGGDPKVPQTQEGEDNDSYYRIYAKIVSQIPAFVNVSLPSRREHWLIFLTDQGNRDAQMDEYPHTSRRKLYRLTNSHAS